MIYPKETQQMHPTMDKTMAKLGYKNAVSLNIIIKNTIQQRTQIILRMNFLILSGLRLTSQQTGILTINEIIKIERVISIGQFPLNSS
ncbi:unnamed protein product [Paramecium sonneborni]|uniref:Uncharacterized protein n=1 Tax=Paramecium sonneborni TaxID=65129 RepID=A0A8S1P7Y1_9CILI|nr:unnamed protein product [Paramecium sonneborni]